MMILIFYLIIAVIGIYNSIDLYIDENVMSDKLALTSATLFITSCLVFVTIFTMLLRGIYD